MNSLKKVYVGDTFYASHIVFCIGMPTLNMSLICVAAKGVHQSRKMAILNDEPSEFFVVVAFYQIWYNK